jgi:hypothetical protein
MLQPPFTISEPTIIGRNKMEKGWCECRNRPIRSLRQKRGGGVGRRDTREREQGIRMSQDYGRCRNF